jgi:hypothetical protein
VDIDVVTDGRSVLEVLVAVADTAPAHALLSWRVAHLLS